MTTTDNASRAKQALETARKLLDDMEQGELTAENLLLRAQRLARLLRDSDAQNWLEFELIGYPEKLDTGRLGGCAKYISQTPRFLPDGKMYRPSLPQIEAEMKAEEVQLSKGETAKVEPVDNYLAAGATQKVMEHAALARFQQKTTYAGSARLRSAIRGVVHRYATDCYLALEFGNFAETIFETARARVDAFVRATCPAAVEQLLAISERIKEGLPESRAEALTSCRRVLASVADAVFPASADPYTDRRGKQRKVGAEQYVNRLVAFVEKRITSASDADIVESEVTHLAVRLDAVYEKVCKGVHADVSADEASLAVIHSYLIIAEVAKAAAAKT